MPSPESQSPEERKARRKLEKFVGRKLPQTLHCGFCGRSQHDVGKLIAGPYIFICDACVTLCADIVAGRPAATSDAFNPLERPTDELLSLMGSVNYAADGARDFLQRIVDTLRRREVSWQVVADHLGVSRQSAWERFS